MSISATNPRPIRSPYMLSHIPLALAIQIATWLIARAFGIDTPAGLWLGFFAATSVCMMREITQHEYRWIETMGHRRRRNMKRFEGTKFWDWNRHSKRQTIGAVLATAVVAGLGSLA